jgi:hypothetical protein
MGECNQIGWMAVPWKFFHSKNIAIVVIFRQENIIASSTCRICVNVNKL